MESLSTTETVMTKNKPQLRFPEFDSKWERIKLSKKCSFFQVEHQIAQTKNITVVIYHL